MDKKTQIFGYTLALLFGIYLGIMLNTMYITTPNQNLTQNEVVPEERIEESVFFTLDYNETMKDAPTTGSMEPFAKRSNKRVYHYLDDDIELEIGRWYCYHKKEDYNRVTCHQLIKINPPLNETSYVFKGWNNAFPDQRVVTREDIDREVVGMYWEASK